MTLTADRVVAASNAWVWIDPEATVVDTGEALLVRRPQYAEYPLEVLSFRPTGSTAGAVDRVLDRARDLGLAELVWWVRLDSPADLAPVLTARGGLPRETVSVLALDLAPGAPDLGAVEVELRWATDTDTTRDIHRVTTAVWGGAVPPDAAIGSMLERNLTDLEEGRGGPLVAYLDGQPVGTGGVTIADGVARMWSGAVVGAARGRGIYRAMLGERIRYGLTRGATMALVKGVVDTSGPILRRAGFEAYGEERSYRVPLV